MHSLMTLLNGMIQIWMELEIIPMIVHSNLGPHTSLRAVPTETQTVMQMKMTSSLMMQMTGMMLMETVLATILMHSLMIQKNG